MNRAPAFQWYAKDYLSDGKVQLLSLEEEGAFIRLLSYCWVDGSVPSDLGKLSRLCKGCSQDLLAGVVELFERDDPAGVLRHRRLEDERKKQDEFRAKQAENGSLGGRPRKETQTKGLGFSGLTQPKAKKSSSSSSSAICNLQPEGIKATTFALTPDGDHAPEPFIQLPLNDGSLFPISEGQIASWEGLYPAIDVRQELRNYRGHFDAEPSKRKTKSGILKSVNYWLSQAQNRSKGGNNGARTSQPGISNSVQTRTDRLKDAAAGAFHDYFGSAGQSGSR